MTLEQAQKEMRERWSARKSSEPVPRPATSPRPKPIVSIFPKKSSAERRLARNAATRARRARKDYVYTLRELFHALRYSAKRRGVEMPLTFEQFADLRARACDYCGDDLPARGHGMDRKDNSKGYLFDNVAPCCSDCNYMKGDDISYEEMKAAMAVRLPVERQKFIDQSYRLFENRV